MNGKNKGEYILNNLLIPFALVNNKIKNINDIYKQDEVYCLECGEKLLLRNGDKNIKHLAHYTNSNCLYKNETEYKKMGGESYEHKFAKEFIKDNMTYFRLYGNQIIIKDGEFKLGGYKDLKINNIQLEYRGLKEELGLEKNYIADILIRTDEALIALEIYNSNKKIVSDLEENLKGKNIYVYEIDITKISVLSFKDIFKNMKLIFSNLKLEFEKTIKPIQNKIIECENLKKDNKEKDTMIKNISQDRDNMELELLLLKDNEDSTRDGKYLEKRIKYLESIIVNLKEKEKASKEENKKCWSKCARDWYSSKLNNQINLDIKRCIREEERKVLNEFRCFYNGKVGGYSSNGGDSKLKEIAEITKNYNSAIKYLGINNNRFKELLKMEIINNESDNIDIGEQILRQTLLENILEVE